MSWKIVMIFTYKRQTGIFLIVMDRCIGLPCQIMSRGSSPQSLFIQFENRQDPPPCIFLMIILICINKSLDHADHHHPRIMNRIEIPTHGPYIFLMVVISCISWHAKPRGVIPILYTCLQIWFCDSVKVTVKVYGPLVHQRDSLFCYHNETSMYFCVWVCI